MNKEEEIDETHKQYQKRVKTITKKIREIEKSMDSYNVDCFSEESIEDRLKRVSKELEELSDEVEIELVLEKVDEKLRRGGHIK